MSKLTSKLMRRVELLEATLLKRDSQIKELESNKMLNEDTITNISDLLVMALQRELDLEVDAFKLAEEKEALESYGFTSLVLSEYIC